MQRDLILYARETLKNFVKIIDKKLVQIWLERIPQIIDHPIFVKSPKINLMGKQLMEHIMEHNSRPAKRLRASFIYYGYKLIAWNEIPKDIEEKLLVAASSIEFTHTGLLIHDDYQDRDSVRRGLPTTHKYFEKFFDENCDTGDREHFWASMCINSWDFALNLGDQTLLRSWFDPKVLIPALDILLEWVGQTVFWQSFDFMLECCSWADEQDVYDLHHGKTGIYTYLTPLLIWVTLGWWSEDLKHKLMEYAIPCGIAFQLQDDVIWLFWDEEKTGKSAFSDIKEGKKTLLMLKTMELCSEHEREILRELWWKADLTIDQAEFVRSIVKSCGALEYSYNKAVEFARKAELAIQELRTTDKQLNTDVLDYLEWIAEYMAVRRDV